MTGSAAEILAVVLLAAALGAAIVRPFGRSESLFAVPAALVLVVVGAEPWSAAGHAVRQLGPTVAFLVAILIFGQLCAEFGVFAYLGARAQRTSHGTALRLLPLVVVLAAAVTAVLTLDATVVLLTPVVLATTARMRIASRPHAFACLHLANSGSLLLPVSNLTNLLAYTASGLSFGRFTVLMTLPWIIACGLEYLALRVGFRAELHAEPIDDEPPDEDQPPAPRYALAVLAVTVVGFVAVTAVGLSPAWAAAVGCVALGVPALRQRRIGLIGLLRAAHLGFAAFVFALSVLVDGVSRHGLGRALHHVAPHGSGLWAMVGMAFLAAALSNVVNNLPATLALIPVVSGNPALVLAMLIGVNVGPNLTYPGSLANLLWNRLLPAEERPSRTSFYLFGIATVPVVVAITTTALWAALAL